MIGRRISWICTCVSLFALAGHEEFDVFICQSWLWRFMIHDYLLGLEAMLLFKVNSRVQLPGALSGFPRVLKQVHYLSM